ncbi:MAG: hypothetical protein ACR2NL_05725 [Acidimicrobiia bacterium]
MTPFIESRTGRLTELVYLLSDRPLSLVHQAVLDAEAESGDGSVSDPWLVVASAMQRLQTMTEATLQARHKRTQQAREASADRELVVT